MFLCFYNNLFLYHSHPLFVYSFYFHVSFCTYSNCTVARDERLDADNGNIWDDWLELIKYRASGKLREIAQLNSTETPSNPTGMISEQRAVYVSIRLEISESHQIPVASKYLYL